MFRTLLSRPWIFELGARFYAWFTAQAVWRTSCARLVAHFPASRAAGKALIVLDLGCGPGVTVLEMAGHRPDARYIGLDLAPRMLDEARAFTAGTPNVGRIDYVLADASALPFAADCIDIVTGHSFLYLVGNRKAVLAEAYRVVRPAGRYASMEPHGGGADWGAVLRDYGRQLRMMTAITLWRPFSHLHGQLRADRFRALLEAAGFRNFTSELTLHGLGIIGDAEK